MTDRIYGQEHFDDHEARAMTTERAAGLREFIDEVDAALRDWKRPILGTNSLNGNIRAQEAQSTEAMVRINAARARLDEQFARLRP